MSLAVVAIGGNSLSRAEQVGTIAEQWDNAAHTCRSLADLIEKGWDVVVTHGNGPQVGQALRRVELARGHVYPLPLYICDADTEGGIGFMLQQILGNELTHRGVKRTVSTLITQVRVDPNDQAFSNPTKPIGQFYSAEDARTRSEQDGWQMREDAKRGWRRVVPSPMPIEIVELDAVRRCVQGGIIPIAVGGGGVPVVLRNGKLEGVEAVIDKDLASALLARELRADLLVIATAVESVQVGFGTPAARSLRAVEREEMRRYAAAGEFPAGSMGPKIQAALQFLDHGGKRVVITDPEHLGSAAAGEAGTHIY
ncbi:MAG: carbamate kinase [Myxococcota bacterium]